MINQDDTSDRPMDINQLQWALRHGQKVDGLENIMISNQPVMIPDNYTDKNIEKNSICEDTILQNKVLKEQIDQLGQSLNREIVSLKGEFAIVAQGTVLEEQIQGLLQSLTQEISSLKSAVEIAAQGRAVEEQIDKLGQSLNQEILSLKSEFTFVDQGADLDKQIDKLSQSLQQEISSLKSEFGIFTQSVAVDEQIDKLAKPFSQEILSLRNEFAMFVQAQLNQEKGWKIAEIEWKNILEDRETRLQAEMWEIQHNILGKLEEQFQQINEKMENNNNILRQEVSLLTDQFAEFQRFEDREEEVLVTEWQKKMEERQTRLIEDMAYIHYVLEDIATRPHSTEAQQKLRENFFIREISILKEAMAAICQQSESSKKGSMLADNQQYNNSVLQQEINLNSEDQTQVYKRKRRRRH